MPGIRQLCQYHGAKGYYSHSAGLVAVRVRGAFLWYGWRGAGYLLVGSTDGREGADYRRLD